ncbi:MAG: DUF2062 domain-containing protein [Nitrosomonadales bacterium]|nr:DUF2062 domain-containing protein [Nitrosomonadales bacterium]
MRKLFRKYLPHHETVVSHPWLKPYGHWLQHPNLWHLHRRSVAGGVAIGLFCGLIPGPLQMISAAILAILFRVNLPVAAFTTLYTNPLTIVPLYALAYEFGKWVSGAHKGVVMAQPSFSELHWHNLMSELWDWLEMLGEPFLIGLPLLALSLAFIGYIAVRVTWRVVVIWKWYRRKQRRKAS